MPLKESDYQISPIFHCRILSALIPKRLFRARDWITLDPHLFHHPLDHPKWRSTFWTPKNTPGFCCGFPERYKNSLTLSKTTSKVWELTLLSTSVNLREKRGVRWRLDGAGPNSAELPRCHSNMARLLPSVAGVVATKKTAANMEFLQHSKWRKKISQPFSRP